MFMLRIAMEIRKGTMYLVLLRSLQRQVLLPSLYYLSGLCFCGVCRAQYCYLTYSSCGFSDLSFCPCRTVEIDSPTYYDHVGEAGTVRVSPFGLLFETVTFSCSHSLQIVEVCGGFLSVFVLRPVQSQCRAAVRRGWLCFG